MGIETLTINGVHKDYLNIRYQPDDKLYVPVDQIDLVQKYVGSEGKEPKLYKLGGTEWKRVKSKVQSSVENIADDLIKLYAEREAAKGYAFSPDGDMQREFETSFAYNETEDQLRSKSKRIWNGNGRWIVYYAAMLDMGRRRWRSGPLLKP